MNKNFIQLETTEQGTGKRSDSYVPRLENIQWIRKLKRAGLKNGFLEKSIVIWTKEEETLSIQFPGSESLEKGVKKRPWDFRPKLSIGGGGKARDLEFRMIWHTLLEKLAPITETRPDLIKEIGMLFYRMAYMVDHKPKDRPTFPTFKSGLNPEKLSHHKNERFGKLWLYEPPEKVISGISREGGMNMWRGMSFEAFLRYNDLLAWNEDCKYYYRDIMLGHLKKTDWNATARGRTNTLLTHLNIIGLISGKRLSHQSKMVDLKVDPEYLFGTLGRISRGVAPANGRMINMICGELLKK